MQGFFTIAYRRDRYGGHMTKLAALLVLLPITAAAEDAVPITSPSQVTTTTTTTVTTTTVEEDPCHVSSRHWRDRMRGRLSIGFSRSHVELRDDEGEGSQRSF